MYGTLQMNSEMDLHQPIMAVVMAGSLLTFPSPTTKLVSYEDHLLLYIFGRFLHGGVLRVDISHRFDGLPVTLNSLKSKPKKLSQSRALVIS